MNYVKTIIIAAMLGIVCAPGLHAQNIDHERMNRDIHIMDNVLQELFKTQWSAVGSTAKVSSGVFSWGDNSDINGTYLPAYGVIFTIPGESNLFVLKKESKGNASNYAFQYGSAGDKEVNKETIISRIKEFLSDYGSTIGQLEDSDHITVIYDTNHSGQFNFVRIFSQDGTGKNTREEMLPSIYVTVKKSDLKAYKSGRISEKQFNDRLAISTIDKQNADHQDIKIMANILKTSLENSENNTYKISGAINHIYIDDLGALFYLHTSYGSGIYTLTNAARAIQVKLAKIDSSHSVSGHIIKGTPVQGKIANPYIVSGVDGKSQTELKKEHEEAYHQFLHQLKETMVDYGRTLKSVKSDEQVYVSVSLSAFGNEIPSHVGLQIKKSTLEALDKGSISRNQAMQQITVLED